MRVEQFAMERMQSTWENLVDYNLSEAASIHSRRASSEDQADALLDQPLVYTQSNGTIERGRASRRSIQTSRSTTCK